MRKLTLCLLFFYKRNISVFVKYFFGGGCRFVPTCSEYAYDAVSRYGVLKGLMMAFRRVVKCNPLSKPQYDPVN